MTKSLFFANCPSEHAIVSIQWVGQTHRDGAATEHESAVNLSMCSSLLSLNPRQQNFVIQEGGLAAFAQGC